MWLFNRYDRYDRYDGHRGKQLLPWALLLSLFALGSGSRWGRSRRLSALVSVDVQWEKVEGFPGLGGKLPLVVGGSNAALGVAADAPLCGRE